MRKIVILFFLFVSFTTYAQFDPAGGEIGSKAIHFENNKIIGWSSKVTIQRGWAACNDTSLGRASQGFDDYANGKANGECTSLGDSGIAIVELEIPIADNQGYEFAIFENGFKSNGGYFLELAHVEVSSDGIHYVRFPSETFFDTINQFTNASVMDPTQAHNLAGKNPMFWGTPFDLKDLNKSEYLNTDSIKYIKIIDAVGSLNPMYGSKDGKGKPINDPWPTPWLSSGFDLDAVAILSPGYTGLNELVNQNLSIFPNPSASNSLIQLPLVDVISVSLLDAQGKSLVVNWNENTLTTPHTKGIYQLIIQTQNGQFLSKLCVY